MMGEPLHRVAALGIDVAGAEAAGDLREDPVVVARLADRLARLLHGDQEGLAPGIADVVALEAVVAGSTMSAIFAAGVQNCSLNTIVSGLRHARAQAVEVLVMMERIAARPVDQADVGIGDLLPVVRDLAARIEQHVGEARDRDEVGHRVGALRQRRAGEQRAPLLPMMLVGP